MVLFILIVQDNFLIFKLKKMSLLKKSPYIPIVKHLEDLDDLTLGRDSGLVANQENLAYEIAQDILELAHSEDIKTFMFYISTKKRARETAIMVRQVLRSISKKSINVLMKYSENLREIDQGSFILPPSYKPGDNFEGLSIANKILSKERFGESGENNDNLFYRFGDPVKLNEGVYKYPELVNYFNAPGESYADVLIRFYTEVIAISQCFEGNKHGIYHAVFTHGQPHQIFNDLSIVSHMMCENNFRFKTGTLPRI